MMFLDNFLGDQIDHYFYIIQFKTSFIVHLSSCAIFKQKISFISSTGTTAVYLLINVALVQTILSLIPLEMIQELFLSPTYNICIPNIVISFKDVRSDIS